MTVRSTRCGVRERRTKIRCSSDLHKIELQVLELRLKKKKSAEVLGMDCVFDGANVTE